MSWCGESEVNSCNTNKSINHEANEELTYHGLEIEDSNQDNIYLNRNIYQITNNIQTEKLIAKKHRSLIALALTLVTTTVGAVKPALAEGSRTLYPPGTPGFRANLEWQPQESYFAGTGNRLRARTLLKVYARQGESILLGSSAVGVSPLADIQVFNPGVVTGPIGDETIPALSGVPNNGVFSNGFSCNAQSLNTNRGRILNRAQELAGPQAVTGGGNLSGYVPCVYTAPVDGIYDVVFRGPNGDTGTGPIDRGEPTGEITLANANNFNAQQGSSVAAWDVTVRSSDFTSVADLNGRLFTFYSTLYTDANPRPVNIKFYPVTTDGYRYEVDLKGTDPNLGAFYANRAGFLDLDGRTPVYHDVISSTDLLTTLQGGVIPVRPEFPIFFSNTRDNSTEVNNTLAALGGTNLLQSGAASLPPLSSSIPTTAALPSVSNFSFTGTAGGNNSIVSTNGTFSYSANVAHSYQIVISRDGVNFDPTLPTNRVLRGLNLQGNLQVPWDLRDNSGNQFPIGVNYQARMQIQAGDYHFPLLDVENSLQGGPAITLLNPPATCPLPGGCNVGFYDDRGYRLSNGGTVGTVNTALPGNVPPAPPNSDTINGFDTTTSQRRFGDATPTGWGDKKGLDLWTYFPSVAPLIPLNIVGPNPDLKITKSNSGNFVVGKQGTYSITVENKTGVGPATGAITVTDTLPNGLTYVSGTGTDWSCSASGQTVTCNYTGATPVAPGVVLPVITITVNVTPAAASPQPIINTASVTTPGDTPDSPTGGDNTFGNPTNVLLPPVAYKSVKFFRDNNGNNSLNFGDDIQYTLIIENPSTNPAALTDVVIRDTVPAQVQLLQDGSNPISVVTTNNGTNPNFTLAAGNFNGTTNGTVTFTNPGTLAPGGRVTITFNARVLPGAASPIANQGTVNYGGDAGTPVRTDASDTNNPTAPGSNNNPGNPGTGTGNNISQPNTSDNDFTIINIVNEINPAGTKSVRLVVDADNSGTVTTGDTIEYTITYFNNNPDFTVNDFLVTDSINTSYIDFVPGSYSFQSVNGSASSNNATTVTGNSNYNGTTDINLTNPTTRGSLGAGGGRVVMTFRALIKAPANTSIPNQAVATSTASREGVVTRSPSRTDAISTPIDIPQPVGGTDDPTQVPVVEAGPPRLRLVKRITRVVRNGVPLSGVNFSEYVSVNAEDRAPGWSQLSPVGVASLPPAIAIQSGDEVEYTIYYLSDGSGPGNDLKFCDLIPAGTTYLSDSFGLGSGISFNRSGTVRSLTNNADADEATFFAPIAPLPSGNTCTNQNNPDGAAIVNLGTVLNTTGNNYGFVRFRVKVK